MVATHVVSEDDIITQPPGSLVLKKEIWSLPIPPKIQHFFWKAVSGALPTAERLHSRFPAVDPLCQRCCLSDETINHVLFECPHSLAIWRCASFRGFDHVYRSLEANIQTLLLNKNTASLSSTSRLLPFWIVWMIWKSRNAFLFRQTVSHPSEDATKGSHAVAEWLLANPWPKCDLHTTSIARSSAWEPPPPGWLKCNFDCSFKKDEVITGLGWLVRDANGRFVEAGWAKLPPVRSPFQAEASGFLFVLQHIWIRGWRKVWFEGDSTQLQNVINRNEDNYDLGNILHDIRHWISLLPLCSLGSINRERNQASDYLAKLVYNSDQLCHVFSSPSKDLLRYLYAPFTV